MHALSHPGWMPRASWLSLLLLLAAGSLLLVVRATPPIQPIDIPGIPPQALEQAGIRFLPPDSKPAIGAEEANVIAIREAPTFDLPISQTVLIRLVDVSAVPPINQLVWVNMIDLTGQRDLFPAGPAGDPGLFPSGPYVPDRLPPASRPQWSPRTYHLIFVDAKTGEYLYAILG